MAAQAAKEPRLPPKPVIRIAWAIHRAIHRLTGGRRGLWRPKAKNWGTTRVQTIGRRSGRERAAILGYFEEGPNLVTMAMNGWMAEEPAWWLNLQANPEARVELKGETRRMRARAAEGAEHDRLWSAWAAINPDLDGYAKRRPKTSIVILEPIAE